MRCLLATTTVTYQSSVPQLYIALHSSDHCWLISSFGLVTSHSPWSAVVTVLELECWNSYFNFNSQQAQSLWLLPPPTPTSPPRFFLFFNWWKLKATIKEKQKDLVKLIAFLTLCYHISIQNLVEMFCAHRGIMMTHTARSGAPNTFQWYSNVPTPTRLTQRSHNQLSLFFSGHLFCVRTVSSALVTIKVCQVKFLSFILCHFVTQSPVKRGSVSLDKSQLSPQTKTL